MTYGPSCIPTSDGIGWNRTKHTDLRCLCSTHYSQFPFLHMILNGARQLEGDSRAAPTATPSSATHRNLSAESSTTRSSYDFITLKRRSSESSRTAAYWYRTDPNGSYAYSEEMRIELYMSPYLNVAFKQATDWVLGGRYVRYTINVKRSLPLP